jgi:hypothetical protein
MICIKIRFIFILGRLQAFGRRLRTLRDSRTLDQSSPQGERQRAYGGQQ